MSTTSPDLWQYGLVFDEPTEDPHAAYDPTEEDLTRGREAGEAIGTAAQKLGLYQQEYQIGTATGPDGVLRMVVISTFLAGDITFTDRILNPEESDINDEFITIKTDLENQEFEEYREQQRKRLEDE